MVVPDCDEVNAREINLAVVDKAIDFLDTNTSCAGVFANQIVAYYDPWTTPFQQEGQSHVLL